MAQWTIALVKAAIMLVKSLWTASHNQEGSHTMFHLRIHRESDNFLRKLLGCLALMLLLAAMNSNVFAGDKEDVLASINKTVESFNKHDFSTYFSMFAEDNTEFPYVASPLRHDAAAWKAFVEGTAALEYVNYHQQDEHIQTYNGNSAVVTAYYTFTWKPKGGELNTQSGRASMFLVKQGGKWLSVHMHFSKMF